MVGRGIPMVVGEVYTMVGRGISMVVGGCTPWWVWWRYTQGVREEQRGASYLHSLGEREAMRRVLSSFFGRKGSYEAHSTLLGMVGRYPRVYMPPTHRL